MTQRQKWTDVVRAALAAADAAKACGVANTAPYGLIVLIAKRDVETDRFPLAAGEKWSAHVRRFSTDTVEIGGTRLPLAWFDVVKKAEQK